MANTNTNAWAVKHSGPTPAAASRLHRVKALINQLDDKWSDLQIGRQGKYSIERLESLDHYCKTTSRTRALLVCLLTPLPVLLVVVLLECLPLRLPSDGWAANWVFWTRLSLMVFMSNVAILLMLKLMVPVLPLNNAKVILVATDTTVCTMCCYILAAKFVGFPVPFLWQLGFFVDSISITLMLIFAVGTAPFARDSPCRPDLLRFHGYFSASGVLVACYPLFKVIYDHLPTMYQGPAMPLLTIWKFGAKKFMARSVRELEDFMPQLVACNTDFFTTLFVSVCMYSAGSISVSMLVISFDVLASILEYREVRMHAKTVDDLLRRTRRQNLTRFLTLASRREGENTQEGTEDLLALILAVTRDTRLYSMTDVVKIRIWASLPHPLPVERLESITSLEILPSDSRTSITTKRLPQQSSRRQKHRLRNVKVAALPSGKLPPLETAKTSRFLINDNSLVGWNPERSKALVVQGLQLLFHCEYLALVEYIECVTPLVFVTYKSVLRELPNAVYYPGGAASWTARAIGNILLLSLLEFGSFVALMMLLQRKFAFSSLHQLAFVLETQVIFVQVSLFTTAVCLLPFELEHLGADSTLRFEWLKHN